VNTFKKEKKPKKKREAGKVSKSLANIFSGSFLSKDNVVGLLPFIFFLTFIGILYIANGYYAEKVVRELHKTGNEVKELRSEYITIKSDLNFKSKQSQVAQATEPLEIYESTTPPTKILIDEDEQEKIAVAN
jgi:Bacteriodetes cell division protein (FtsL-like)